MAQGANTYTDVSALINAIYEDALLVAREQTFMDLLVTPFSGSGMGIRKVTQYGTASINDLAETDDIVGQQISRNLLSSLTPVEKGGQFFLSDQRVETDTENVRVDAALELGTSMAQKIEADLLGNIASLTGGTVGAAGSTFTWGYFFAAQSILRNNKIPGPYYAVMHPYQWHRLASAVLPAAGVQQTNAPAFQDEVLRNFWQGSVSGVNIFISSTIPVDGSDDAIAGVFARPAIALDMRRAPRLEPERDASRRGWELNLTSIYAQGLWRPTYGVQIKTDASVPTS